MKAFKHMVLAVLALILAAWITGCTAVKKNVSKPNNLQEHAFSHASKSKLRYKI
jgi:hypothetical protein